MYKYKNDRFQKNRGGSSRVLDIRCSKCAEHVAYYQKDGPGILKRMYVDRFIDMTPTGSDLICTKCQQSLGTKFNYKKENRPAYRLYVGAISKSIISARELDL